MEHPVTNYIISVNTTLRKLRLWDISEKEAKSIRVIEGGLKNVQKVVEVDINIVAMIFTANNIYPYNLFLHFVGLGGWLIVAIVWNDRALIVINAVALAIFANGMVAYILKTYFP